MRAGGTSAIFQQSLTPEASSIVKQATSLARRRGHVQVTPLHVAAAMLSVPTGLLRAACVQSHSQSHPLRCRALDLCFNVALNRLPSSSQIIAGPYRTNHPPPSLSNALVAVFKRAQAHQRRGSAVDAHQQAMLVVRIDVEQLIVSILDDPSVSRVMREAGFSSTQVKINVERAVSLEMTSPEPNPNPNTSLNLEMTSPEPNPNPNTSLNLDLSLNHDSQLRSKRSNDDGPLLEDVTRNKPTALPPWLLQHREESRRATITDQVFIDVKDSFKWNSVSSSGCKQHCPLEKTLDFLSKSPSFSFPSESPQTHQASSSNPNSTSSTETFEVEYLSKFKELNAENLKILCNSLEKICCQKEVVPKIASTILQCRSGMMRRKESTRSAKIKEETWFLFLGTDTESKEKIARGLAAIVFGSHTNIISIGHCEFSSSDDRSKRSRLEAHGDYLERFAGAIEDNPHRVFLLEDISQVDHNSQVGILNAIRSGMVRSSTRELGISVGDAIIILTCENSDLGLRAGVAKQKYDNEEEREEICEEEMNLCVGFDLNRHAVDHRDWDGSCEDIDLHEAVDRTLVFECEDHAL